MRKSRYHDAEVPQVPPLPEAELPEEGLAEEGGDEVAMVPVTSVREPTPQQPPWTRKPEGIPWKVSGN